MALAATADLPAAPVLILMGVGVLVAIGGHLYGSRRIVAMGICVLFLATAAMVAGGFAAYNDHERDPRPAEQPQSPDF